MPLHIGASDYLQDPRRRPAALGMWLFLASLTMLFVSGMMLYVFIRTGLFGHAKVGPVRLPKGMWASTVVLIAGSFTIHKALISVRLERIGAFIRQLKITFVLAVAFLAIQFPCLVEVLNAHRALVGTGMGMYGLVFCLILLHALHVIGGIVAMGIVTVRAGRGKYDHENYFGVQNAALYWHFLDLVWLVMFGVFNVIQ
jgi:cytochrome c oxidase subunit 3